MKYIKTVVPATVVLGGQRSVKVFSQLYILKLLWFSFFETYKVSFCIRQHRFTPQGVGTNGQIYHMVTACAVPYFFIRTASGQPSRFKPAISEAASSEMFRHSNGEAFKQLKDQTSSDFTRLALRSQNIMLAVAIPRLKTAATGAPLFP